MPAHVRECTSAPHSVVRRRTIGKVTADAFDTITGMIVDRITALGEIDAVYLDLHGAMVTDAFDDGDLKSSAVCAKRLARIFPSG